MECRTVSGERVVPRADARAQRRGFTLIELLVVMGIIGLLLALALPRYFKSLERAKDVALVENLKVMRTQIDRFYADRGRYPETLHELVDARYLREVPVDPITESREGWSVTPPPDAATGVMDVHSSARGQTRDGIAYDQL
jgi:general secretion pathway protein G